MTRVSLKEAYDNKDVVAQIYAIRDTAESAVDTSEQAVTTANTASDHVDALVPQVEGAVENANSASASAQASAQTVAGYENRLGAVETGLGDAQGDITAIEGNVAQIESDLNAVTLRVQTAEDQIVTIQGRVTALETADGQNVKINAINDYAVGLTGNQTAHGKKSLTVGVELASLLSSDVTEYTWYKVGKLYQSRAYRVTLIEALPYNNSRRLLIDALVVTQFIPTAGTVADVYIEELIKKNVGLSDNTYLGVAYDPVAREFYLFIRTGQYVHDTVYVESVVGAGELLNASDFVEKITPVADDPTTYTNHAVI